MIPNEALLAILQRQIKIAFYENKVDVSKFPTIKTVADVSTLTDDEKKDIGKNVYQFLFETNTKSLYVLTTHYASGDWSYSKLDCRKNFIISDTGPKIITFEEHHLVTTDVNGDVTFTSFSLDPDDLPLASELKLETDKYPDVTFYANYFTVNPNTIYRFSSGIILDSSSETPQYKIVFASYNVKVAKVTFVEKVLS